MSRVNIVKKIKISDGQWVLRSIPRKPSGGYDWNDLPGGTSWSGTNVESAAVNAPAPRWRRPSKHSAASGMNWKGASWAFQDMSCHPMPRKTNL